MRMMPGANRATQQMKMPATTLTPALNAMIAPAHNTTKPFFSAETRSSGNPVVSKVLCTENGSLKRGQLFLACQQQWKGEGSALREQAPKAV